MNSIYIKENVSDLEIELQEIASKYKFAPKILKTEKIGNKNRVHMEHINALCIADAYGDDPSNIPRWMWNEIRKIVETLYNEEGIEYIDITGYNFIEKDGRIYIIDFGDAKYDDGELNWFLKEFLNGENAWNPDYA
jgi:tRNA A-37 threonylcarbamoyl transferase component Bud32